MNFRPFLLDYRLTLADGVANSIQELQSTEIYLAQFSDKKYLKEKEKSRFKTVMTLAIKNKVSKYALLFINYHNESHHANA